MKSKIENLESLDNTPSSLREYLMIQSLALRRWSFIVGLFVSLLASIMEFLGFLMQYI